MIDAIQSLAIIALAIRSIFQQRALRILRRDHRILRRAHQDALVWYTVLASRRPRPAAIEGVRASH